jgi:Putative neutral zinc metallopeptidase
VDKSSDIEDRRGQRMGGAGFGGLGGLAGLLLARGLRGRHIGIGGLLLLLLGAFLLSHFFESGPVNPGQAVSPYGTASRSIGSESENKEVQFVSFVLDDAQNTWDRLLPQKTGIPYRHAKLVLFRDYTASSCGAAQSATGPFYCPADEKVYLDLGFFDELANRMGAPGEFWPGLRDRTRTGPPCPKVAGHRIESATVAFSQPLAIEPAFRSFGAAGGLPGRCLGPFHGTAKSYRPVRYQFRSGCCRCSRGRSNSEDGQRVRESRNVHSRNLGRTLGVVSPWSRFR